MRDDGFGVRMRHLAPLAALLLAACQPQAADPAPAPSEGQAGISSAPPPGPVVSDFSQPMTARGTEPFWAVRIEGTRFTLLRPDQPETVFEAPGATIIPGRATWEARRADGAIMKLTLFASECSDGMSDLKYPMTAEVELGAETFRGCAAKTAELPREGGR